MRKGGEGRRVHRVLGEGGRRGRESEEGRKGDGAEQNDMELNLSDGFQVFVEHGNRTRMGKEWRRNRRRKGEVE